MTIEQALEAFGLGPDDRAAWQATGLAQDALEEWLTDRVARRPTGPRARAVYDRLVGAGGAPEPFLGDS